MKKTTTMLSLTLAGSLAVTPAMAADLFHDVSQDHWFSESVAAAYDLGLMQGTGPDTFAPPQPDDPGLGGGHGRSAPRRVPRR